MAGRLRSGIRPLQTHQSPSKARAHGQRRISMMTATDARSTSRFPLSTFNQFFWGKSVWHTQGCHRNKGRLRRALLHFVAPEDGASDPLSCASCIRQKDLDCPGLRRKWRPSCHRSSIITPCTGYPPMRSNIFAKRCANLSAKKT